MEIVPTLTNSLILNNKGSAMYSIGLDISKATIDIFIPINQSNIQIKNDTKSISFFYRELKKLYIKDINELIFVFEPTANYSNLLKTFCTKNNIRCFIVNSKRSMKFCKSDRTKK